jgi:hypothetical protein
MDPDPAEPKNADPCGSGSETFENIRKKITRNLSLAFPASPFLAEINNEQMPRNRSYKARLESLDNLVLIMWSNDTTLIPPQSAHFGFFDASMKIQPLR